MELTIEKLIYGGDGLARDTSGGARAKSVFVPYVLPGERIEANILETRSGFSRARLERVLMSSPLRAQPPCQYFGSCGGCHYQHASYDDQLRFKSEILREALQRTGKIELAIEIQTHSSPALHYRNRTRFHLRPSPDFAIGYFRHGSHELLPVRECPISSPLINKALTEVWNFGASGQIPREIDEVEFFADADDEHLMVEVYVQPNGAKQPGFERFARALPEAIHSICGISVFATSAGRNPVLKSGLLYGEPAIQYRVGTERYRVSAGAFFQTNRYLVSRMVELAVGERRGRLALDLYSGVGLFAVPLARRFERVIAVESSPISSDDLRANVPENVKVSSQAAEAYLTSAASTLKPDLVIVDPPRSGLGPGVCARISELSAQEIVYVSCDPATLARDLRQLTSTGWKISAMHLVDLFPQTFHIETITVLAAS